MIIRVHKQERFTTIDNAFLNNVNLSFKAKGMFAYMLSRPNNWKFNEKHLSSVSSDKKFSVNKVIHELIEAGYVNRHAMRDEKGRMVGYVYDLYENIELAKEGIKTLPQGNLSITQKPYSGEPDTGKPDNGEMGTTKYLKIPNTDNTKTSVKETSDFTTFKDAYTDLLTRYGIDIKSPSWAVVGRKIKDCLGRVDINKLLNALKEWEKDDFNGKDTGFDIKRFESNLQKYTMTTIKSQPSQSPASAEKIKELMEQAKATDRVKGYTFKVEET